MTLSGVCAGSGGQQSGQLVFGASGAGTCHVDLRYADGTTFAKDVTFSAEWLACGSDPHGCGELVRADGLPSDGSFAVLVAGPPCAEGGVAVTPPDAAAE